MFESRLLAALVGLDPARPVIVEAESSKIGDRMVPPGLWTAMETAPRIELSAPQSERVRYLVHTYGDIIADRQALETAFSRLPVYPGRKRLESWRGLADAGGFAELAEALIELHYDPAYARSSRKDARTRIGAVELEALDAASQERAAEAILRVMGASAPEPEPVA